MEESHHSVCRCVLNPLVLVKGPVLSGVPQSETLGIFLARELTCSLLLGYRWEEQLFSGMGKRISVFLISSVSELLEDSVVKIRLVLGFPQCRIKI